MVRVINLGLPNQVGMTNIFKFADHDSTIGLIIRRNIFNLTLHTITQIRDQITKEIIAILASYR